MTIVAETVDHTIGVDSHRDTHNAAVIDAGTTAVINEIRIPNDVSGFADAIAWADTHAPDRRVWAIEGCGSYGKRLTVFLLGAGEQVVEIERPARPSRGHKAKNDSIDAIRAGREVLGQPVDKIASPKTGVERDSLASLLAARRAAVSDATGSANQLYAEILTAPEQLRACFKHKTLNSMIATALSLRPDQWASLDAQASARALRSIARRYRLNTDEAADLAKQMTAIIKNWRPDILEVHGVGTIVAASLLVAWCHPGRFRSYQAFASMAGVCPIPCSSGRTDGKMRLNRGGDRHLNAAIHRVMLCRLRTDETKNYIANAQATNPNKTRRDCYRSLKGYIARDLFKLLETNH